MFGQVRIDPEAHTVVWPNGADFDPATLYDWPQHVEELRARVRQWEVADPAQRCGWPVGARDPTSNTQPAQGSFPANSSPSGRVVGNRTSTMRMLAAMGTAKTMPMTPHRRPQKARARSTVTG